MQKVLLYGMDYGMLQESFPLFMPLQHHGSYHSGYDCQLTPTVSSFSNQCTVSITAAIIAVLCCEIIITAVAILSVMIIHLTQALSSINESCANQNILSITYSNHSTGSYDSLFSASNVRLPSYS